MKHEWKNREKDLYLPKTAPAIITVPGHKFFAIKGKGDPNAQDFADRTAVLYFLSYAVRMMPKSGFTPAGYFEYTVYPLEGIWENTCDITDKDSFSYTLMVRQPDFVNDEVVEKAFEKVKKKKPDLLSLLPQAQFCEIEDGLSVQMLHIGAYDDEPKSFALMHKFIEDNGLIRSTDNHREIYLSDPRKVDREKLKTVLRYGVKRK